MSHITSENLQIELANLMISSIRRDAGSVLTLKQSEISDELKRLQSEIPGDDFNSMSVILQKLAKFIIENFFVSEFDGYTIDSYHPDELVQIKIEVIYQLRKKFSSYEGRATNENLAQIFNSIFLNIHGVSAEA